MFPRFDEKIVSIKEDAIANKLGLNYFASGFGMAGDTDLSWNLLVRMDWWVNSTTSLQLGYRFYEINYKNGTGKNTFGFEQNLNGPFIAATFHF